MPDTSWYDSFIRQGVPEQAAKTAAGYIEKGIDPAIALHITFGLGLDKKPESEWDAFARQNPGQATAKKLLVTAGRDLKEFAEPVTGALKLPDAEKMSAAKLLREYLLHQDMQRAESMKKDALWQQVHNAQVQDQFFVDNKRPPASLGDFALAGMNFRPAPGPQDQLPRSPTSLPGEIAKPGMMTFGPRGR